MTTEEQYCLRWKDFEQNIARSFQNLREEKDFFDVTLVCEDIKQVEAHKVVLSSCSPFFRNILKRNPHEHPLIYLKGVKYKELQYILEFMYHGEVNITNEDLNEFLTISQELQIKGLAECVNLINLKTGKSSVQSVSSKAKLTDPVPSKKRKMETINEDNFTNQNFINPLENDYENEEYVTNFNEFDKVSTDTSDNAFRMQNADQMWTKCGVKRRRKVYSKKENEILLELINTLNEGKYKLAIENDLTTNDERHEIWTEVTNSFNAATGNTLSIQQIRKKYGIIKKNDGKYFDKDIIPN